MQLSFQVGERAKVKCGDVEVCSEQPLERAASRPLTREELIACFKKTDGLSVDVDFSEIQLHGDIFIPKSGLNALRREFYQALKKRITGGWQVLHKQFELRTILRALRRISRSTNPTIFQRSSPKTFWTESLRNICISRLFIRKKI